MFKFFKAIFLIFCLPMNIVKACLHIAIPIQYVSPAYAVCIITRHESGLEKFAGYVSLAHNTTTFFHHDFIYNDEHGKDLQSLVNHQEIVDVMIINSDQNFVHQDSMMINVNLDIDCATVARVFIVQSSLLSEKEQNDDIMCDIVSLDNDLAEDDDDFFEIDAFDEDELSHFNLTDLEQIEPMQLSMYDKFIVGMYALWAMQAAKIKNVYKNFTHWLQSKHNE